MRLLLLAVLGVLSGCGDKLERQVDRVEAFFSLLPVGSSPDFLLIKSGHKARDPVAVVFGMSNDSEFCNELAELYMQRYPLDNYYCERIS